LQKKNPGLIISYTLPVNPDGLSEASARCWRCEGEGGEGSFRQYHGDVFGKRFINKGKSESELGIESANAAYAQIQKLILRCKSDSARASDETARATNFFGIEDAKTLKRLPIKRRGCARCTIGPSTTMPPSRGGRRTVTNTTNTTESLFPRRTTRCAERTAAVGF